MKPVAEWTVGDLQALVNASVQESLTLDYKCSLALTNTSSFRNELSMDVSAFANSAGGRIIYGIVEQNHLPVQIDEGVDPGVLSREWLEQIINSTIKPRVQGVVVKQIALLSGRVAYVLDVPQATSLAPHQASGHRYYKRFNFESVPMEDYEIRDILRRASTPDLFIYFEGGSVEADELGAYTKLSVSIGNRSPEPAYYRVVRIFVPRGLYLGGPSGFDSRNDLFLQFEGALVPVTILRQNFAIPGQLPVFKEQDFALGELKIAIPALDEEFLLGYEVRCPGNVNSRTGSIKYSRAGLIIEGLDKRID